MKMRIFLVNLLNLIMCLQMIKSNRYIVQNFGVMWEYVHHSFYSLNIKYNLEKNMFYSGI